MTLTWIVPQMTSVRAGSKAVAGSSPGLARANEQRGSTASPAPREGAPELPGPVEGAPSCSFCNDKADVVYVHGADLTLSYCGLHAYEILENFPALWYAAEWKSA